MATSNNNEWLHIYQNNLTGPSQPGAVRWPGEVTNATTVTTTTASSVSNQLGRVTRPNNTRRRTRASRRTPTTLLNTDTTNFRAMVQQFTGGDFCGGSTGFMAAPSAVAPRQPLSSYNNSSSNNNNNNSIGLNYYGMGSMNLPAGVGGYNMEFRQPQQQQQHYYTVVADSGGGGGGDHQHGFVQRVQEGGF